MAPTQMCLMIDDAPEMFMQGPERWTHGAHAVDETTDDLTPSPIGSAPDLGVPADLLSGFRCDPLTFPQLASQYLAVGHCERGNRTSPAVLFPFPILVRDLLRMMIFLGISERRW